MSLNSFLEKINQNSEIDFNQTMQVISEYYEYTPSTFSNGLNENKLSNPAGSNEGSCKIFAFAHLNKLNKQQTLNLFGDYYLKDVLDFPQGSDHQNIRNFIQYGWEGIAFTEFPLKEK